MRTRRRIYAEHIAPELLSDPATLRLLERFGLEPIVAIRAPGPSEALLAALGALAGAGLPVGVWPLLDDDSGYWPSEHNAPAFLARADATLARLDAAGIPIKTLLVDLEPRLGIARRVDRGERLRPLGALVADALHPAAPGRRRAARTGLREFNARLAARGIESFATVLPVLLPDHLLGIRACERLLGTPVTDVGFSVVSPMVYTSLISGLLGVDRAVARTWLRTYAWTLGRRRRGTSLSLGLVGTGKLGDELCLRDPLELAEDVDSAQRLGVKDLALFSLEGVLSSAAPEAWLRAFGVRTSSS